MGGTPDVINDACDPVSVGNSTGSCLLWCDDLVVFSKSTVGMQNAINKIADHFNSLGLEVNKTKTKVLIWKEKSLRRTDSVIKSAIVVKLYSFKR